MFPGFLGSRATFMLDVVALAMVAVIPLLLVSIYLTKFRAAWVTHKRLQSLLAAVLLAAVLLFEIDMRLFGWREYAMASPYYQTLLFPVLYVHLTIAVATALLWIVTVATALRHFPQPPRPHHFSRTHRLLGWASTWGMILTALTGWAFYYLAFVAV